MPVQLQGFAAMQQLTCSPTANSATSRPTWHGQPPLCHGHDKAMPFTVVAEVEGVVCSHACPRAMCGTFSCVGGSTVIARNHSGTSPEYVKLHVAAADYEPQVVAGERGQSAPPPGGAHCRRLGGRASDLQPRQRIIILSAAGSSSAPNLEVRL